MDSALYFCADMGRLQKFTLIAKAEKNVIVVFVFKERKVDNIVLLPIRCKVFKGTIIKHPFQN